MNWYASISIRKLLTILILVMTLVPLAMMVVSTLHQLHENTNEARYLAANIAEEVANDQQVLLAGVEQLLSAIPHTTPVQRHDVTATNRLLAEQLKKNERISNILMIDATGQAWASGLPMKSAINAADRRFFKNAMATGMFSSGEFTTGRVLNKPALSFGYPVRDDSGAIVQVATAAFTLTHYDKLLKLKSMPAGTSLLLLDHRGTILFSSTAPDLVGKQDRADLFRKMSDGPDESSFEGVSNIGIPRIFAYKKLRLASEQTPYMYVRAGISQNYVTGKNRPEFLTQMAVFAAMVLFSVAVAAIIGRRGILDKIGTLVGASREIARGKLDLRISDRVSGGELGELGQAFDDMTTALGRSNSERDEAMKRLTLFRMAVDNASDAVGMSTPDGRHYYQNKAFDDLFGTIGDDPKKVYVDRGIADEVFKTIIAGGGWSGEIKMYCRDGAVHHILLRAYANKDEHGAITSLVGIHTDLTAHKQSELQISRLTSLLEESQHIAHVGGWEIDIASNALYWTDETFRIYGISPGEYTPTVESSIAFYAPESIPVITAAVKEAMENGTDFDLELNLVTATGRTIPVHATSRVMRDDTGKVVRIAGAFKDISEQRNLEERRMESERTMLHAQKLESLGIMAGGIAHDFNNLLAAILGNLDLALLRLPPGSPAAANIEQSMVASRKAASLTRQMLAYSGKGTFQVTAIDLNDVVTGNVDMFRTIIPRNISLNIAGDAHLPMIMADAGQIQQVVMNLITNAAEAIGDNAGTITIATGVTECDETCIRKSILPEKATPGRFVFVEVTDTGCGMDNETQRRLFDPFFTTKFTGRGLGMAATHGIVRSHKGIILLESSPGTGTTFRILLPARVENSPTLCSNDEPDGHAALAGGGTILVVDDEDFVLQLGVDFARHLGFATLEARDGEEAVEIFRQHADEIRLVILDLTMPVMDGAAAFAAIKHHSPDARVILSSGYSEQIVDAQFTGQKPDAYIQKPFHLKDLSRKIRQVLESPPS